MTPLSNLISLRDQIKGLEKGSREVDAAVAIAFGWLKMNDQWKAPGDGILRTFPPRFTDSLDAIRALIERVLPGWLVDTYEHRDGSATYVISSPHSSIASASDGPTTCLAALLALIEALISKAQEEHRG